MYVCGSYGHLAHCLLQLVFSASKARLPSTRMDSLTPSPVNMHGEPAGELMKDMKVLFLLGWWCIDVYFSR